MSEQKDHTDNFDIVVLKFADSKVPQFVEKTNKDFIFCGENNDYPEYLIYQYNKCGKHRAIINGKVNYILGDGIEGGVLGNSENEGVVTNAEPVNNDGETMFDVLQKSITDLEIHGGFRWFVTVDKAGKPCDIKHVDFYKLRTAKPKEEKDTTGKVIALKDHGYWYKDKWFKPDGSPNNREEMTFYREWTGKPEEGGTLSGTYVFAYNKYGPGTDYYPLPEYIGSANYIDLDIEISKFHLSSIRNGMMPSKMIQFYTGEPSPDKVKQIERKFEKKFAGSENAGKFVLVFNTNKEKQVDISDLSANELDKQFDLLAKTTQQEIFTGHQVVSPMLFGIKTEGQLGGATELRIAYEVFINTYAKPKQSVLEKIVNYFGGLMGKGSSYKFKQLDPVGVVLDMNDYKEFLPKEFILEKLSVPKQYWEPQQIQPVSNPLQTLPAAPQANVNEHVKNLTGKQSQQLSRIINNYAKGRIKKEAAKILLKTGFGFSDEEIEVMLTDEEQPVEMLSQMRQSEIDEVVKPELKLNYISDKKILSKRISYQVSDKDGNEITAKVGVKRLQDKIKEEMAELENVINELYAA